MDGQPLCREPIRKADCECSDHIQLIIRAVSDLRKKVYVASASGECLSSVGDMGVTIEQAGKQERQRSSAYRGRFSRRLSGVPLSLTPNEQQREDCLLLRIDSESLAKEVSADWTDARRQELWEQQPIWLFVLLELLAFQISLVGLNLQLTLSRRVHTRSEISHVARRYAAEASIPPRAIGVDRALCSALVPLLLGTISNWPRATIARGRASERCAYARTSAYTRVQKRAQPVRRAAPSSQCLRERDSGEIRTMASIPEPYPACAMISNDERRLHEHKVATT
ncbi:hypothetical protein ALC57_15661 [Trachymyrmex cornetzi]|uniref:Uncharacterized protein n=1 Tax=Trachymyrmex cornetzi TaxID=471704 RepID=A0A151IWG2_9HYME|nr:hypothetical protein ALC57_15661 [Trachymyrmex cornetzi]